MAEQRPFKPIIRVQFPVPPCFKCFNYFMAVGLTFEMLSARGSLVSGPSAQWNSTLWYFSETRRANYGVFNMAIMTPITLALTFLRRAAKRRQTVMFSGTTHEKKRSSGPFPHLFLKQHWVGGFLTNYNMLRHKFFTAMEITDVFDYVCKYLNHKMLDSLDLYKTRFVRRKLAPKTITLRLLCLKRKTKNVINHFANKNHPLMKLKSLAYCDFQMGAVIERVNNFEEEPSRDYIRGFNLQSIEKIRMIQQNVAKPTDVSKPWFHFFKRGLSNVLFARKEIRWKIKAALPLHAQREEVYRKEQLNILTLKNKSHKPRDYFRLCDFYILRCINSLAFMLEEDTIPLFFAKTKRLVRKGKYKTRKFRKVHKRDFVKVIQRMETPEYKELRRLQKKYFKFKTPPFFRFFIKLQIKFPYRYKKRLNKSFAMKIKKHLLVGTNGFHFRAIILSPKIKRLKKKSERRLSIKAYHKLMFFKFLLLKRIPSVIISTDLNGSNYYAMIETSKMRLPYIAPISTLDGYAGISYFMPLGRLNEKQALFYHVLFYRVVLNQYVRQSSKYLFWRNW